MAYPNVFTYNFCSNPGFDAGLAGVTPIGGAVIAQDPTMYQNGLYSLNVTTPGNQSGEGVFLAPGTALASTAGAVSFVIQAADVTETATLNVFAYDVTTASTIGSTTVFFDSTTSWQLVSITGLALVNAHVVAVMVETQVPTATSFNIDSVQYEPSLTLNAGVLPTPYIDGNQPFGTWVGAPGNSASSKPFMNMMGATGGIQTSGSGSILATQVIGGKLTDLGPNNQLVFSDPTSGPTTAAGTIDLSGRTYQRIHGPFTGPGGTSTAFGVVAMLAGLDDFSMFLPTDVDPALSLIGWNNAGVLTGTNTGGNAGYTRAFATFSAPNAQPNSSGNNTWNGASYFAVGFQLASQAAGGAQNITHVQAETVPFAMSTVNEAPSAGSVPTSYVRPRALIPVIAPTDLNYVLNPSFDGGSVSSVPNNWFAITSPASTILIDTVTSHSIDRVLPTSSPVPLSAAIAGTVTRFGAYAMVSNLIVGEVYTVSGYVWPQAANLYDIQVVVSPTAAGGSLAVGSSIPSGTTPPLTQALVSAVGTWYRPNVQFTATNSTMTIAFWGIPITGASGTWTFNLDAVALTPGGLQSYGDGYYPGWAFEGTTGNSRSYYYQRGNIANSVVNQVLAGNLPQGLHTYDAQYFVPPTQYTP